MARLETRAEPLGGWAALAAMSSGSGIMTPIGAENLATCVACVNALSAGIASFPPLVYRQVADGREELPAGHWASRLARQPNDRLSWFELAEFVVASTLLTGNALCVIQLDGAGRPVALEPIRWGLVSVVVLPSGRVAYDVTASTWGRTARPIPVRSGLACPRQVG